MAGIEDVFKALGDPIRIRIVEMLAQSGEMCVCKIMAELEMTQPAISHHLAALKHAGLVRPRKQGQWVHYSLCRTMLFDITHGFLHDLLEQLDASPAERDLCKTEDSLCILKEEGDGNEE